MAYDREVEYKNCFRIGKKTMPIPSSWQTKPGILTRDSKRSIKSGTITAPYLNTIYTTEWTYKYLSSADYDKLYAAYITSCAINKNIKHTFASVDSNNGKVIAYTMYTQSDFGGAIYRINPTTDERYYSNVVFTFVGVGDTPKWFDLSTFKASEYTNY